MGILESARPVIVICARDRAAAADFYRDTLGLKQVDEDAFATIFEIGGEIGGVTIRLSTVTDFEPHEHTILGFRVPDVGAAVEALQGKGVRFIRYPKFGQNELGIWTAPDGKVSVAWFNDPVGNVLSVTNV